MLQKAFHVTAAFVQGDAFHRYNRSDMDAAMVAANARGNPNFSHFGPEANLLDDLEALFRSYSETGDGRVRDYVHDESDVLKVSLLQRFK